MPAGLDIRTDPAHERPHCRICLHHVAGLIRLPGPPVGRAVDCQHQVRSLHPVGFHATGNDNVLRNALRQRPVLVGSNRRPAGARRIKNFHKRQPEIDIIDGLNHQAHPQVIRARNRQITARGHPGPARLKMPGLLVRRRQRRGIVPAQQQIFEGSFPRQLLQLFIDPVVFRPACPPVGEVHRRHPHNQLGQLRRFPSGKSDNFPFVFQRRNPENARPQLFVIGRFGRSGAHFRRPHDCVENIQSKCRITLFQFAELFQPRRQFGLAVKMSP